MKHAFVIACLSALAMTACASADEITPSDAPIEEAAQETVVMEKPTAVVELSSGQRLTFYTWADGSAGVLADRTLDDVPVLDQPEVDRMSVAELFWAVSAPGTEIPEGLLRHHELMIKDEGRDTRLDATERGWMSKRHQAMRAVANPSSALGDCNDSLFLIDYCISSTYPDGPSCFTDESGTVSWTTGATSRYRAAFCLDQGTAKSSLFYDEYTGDSECTTWREYHGIWGDGGTAVYTANKQLSWWWIGPSGAAKRMWGHRAEGVSNANYHWATKFLASETCSHI